MGAFCIKINSETHLEEKQTKPNKTMLQFIENITVMNLKDKSTFAEFIEHKTINTIKVEKY